MYPAADATLDDDQFFGEDAVAFLLEEQVLSVLEEDFGLAQLVVGLTQHRLTDASRGLPTVDLQERHTRGTRSRPVNLLDVSVH